MPSWSELVFEFQEHQESSNQEENWVEKRLYSQLCQISRYYNSSVFIYASAFLQKPHEAQTSITHEDVNGFMNAVHGADTENGLTLILHTPGGDTGAVESIVEYLHSKFKRMNVIIPYLAMSGGAMISLSADSIILGRQSQLVVSPRYLIDKNDQL